jgi:hypothetical protein
MNPKGRGGALTWLPGRHLLGAVGQSGAGGNLAPPVGATPAAEGRSDHPWLLPLPDLQDWKYDLRRGLLSLSQRDPSLGGQTCNPSAQE